MRLLLLLLLADAVVAAIDELCDVCRERDIRRAMKLVCARVHASEIRETGSAEYFCSSRPC